eukprot:maker-scaffold297_size217559-snap-gene-0.27 protein:Tk11578 transcript:maker-scaffold297_size217559-snap-gene-0.27-mRNA-1 annotation:"general transcription factor iih subunit 3"
MSDLVVTTATSDLKEPGVLAEPQGQLLVLVLDMNPNQVFFTKQPESLFHWLDSAISLANSHLMLHPNNAIAAIASHSQSCSFLYPSQTDQDESDNLRQRDGQFEGFYQVEATIRKQAAHILRAETQPTAPVHAESLLSGALSMALSYIHRRRQELSVAESLTSRVLVMSASGDTATQYMNYMNVFFSAQKMGVVIDTCMLEKDAGLLQQGADITGGVYRKVDSRHFPALLQFLTWIFLPDTRLREALSLPSMDRVDYRAACFCHRNLIDIGFVCSVCLSIFCKFSPICTTCHTVFKTPGPLPGMKRKAPAT